MQASLEKLGPTKCRLKIVLTADQIDINQKKEMKRYMQEFELPGFQKGKVPASYIEKRFGKALQQDVLSDLIQSSFENAIKEHNLNFYGSPKFDVDLKNYIQGQDFSYQVEMDVEPEMNLVDLSGQTITKTIAKITAEDVEKVLQDLPKSAPSWNEVARDANHGDRITVNYTGLCQGKGYPHNKAENLQIVLDASGRFMPEFELALYGLKAGDTKKVQITYPITARLKQIAGKTVDLDVSVVKVEEKVYPALDEAFVKSYGIEDGNLDKMREELQKSMENEANKLAETLLRDEVFKSLRELNHFDVPELVLNSLKRRFLNQIDPSAKQKSKEEVKAMLEDPEHKVHQTAMKYARDTMLKEKFIEKFALKPEQAEIGKLVNEYFESLNPMEAYQYMSGKKQLDTEFLRSVALDRQLVRKLLETANIAEVNTPYFEFMKSTRFDEIAAEHGLDEGDDEHEHDEHCGHDHDHDHEHDENCDHDHHH